MINDKLIFDIGAYQLDSTKQYLNNGYKIIALDANPEMIEIINNNFKTFIENGKLIVIDKALHDTDNNEIKFYIQNNEKVWCSIYKGIAERLDECSKIITKQTITLKTLIETYGTPIYCKIDVEGADILAIQSLRGHKELLPKYISCETECLGHENRFDITGTEILDELYNIGYTKFFLIKQECFFNYDFDLNKEHDYMSYEECKKLLIDLREKHEFSRFYDFWYDLYATY